ncbi:MAG: radical SAM/SPASM domain-containing protein [Syntrophales bacterium]
MASYKRGQSRIMSIETFKRCLTNVPEYVDIHFAGFSEPWLNPECTKMVLHAFSKGHKISIFTTLVGMSVNDIEQLSEIRTNDFSVHLPSHTGKENIVVDKQYLIVLERLLKSNISATYHYHTSQLNAKLIDLIANLAKEEQLITRANNLSIESLPQQKRKTGAIRCKRGLRFSILLPNGDVVLCCMDWGLRHVLGNLLECKHSALFKSDEFDKILQGMEDNNSSIICRYCENAINNDLLEKLTYYVNPMRLTRVLKRIINLQND